MTSFDRLLIPEGSKSILWRLFRIQDPNQSEGKQDRRSEIYLPMLSALLLDNSGSVATGGV